MTNELTCIRRGPHRGPVTERPSYAGTGTMIAECELHAEESAERDARHREIYPDSPNPPAWFDPTAAGERWDDDY